MYLCCLCASKFAPEGQFRLHLAPFLRISRRDWVLVRVSRPRRGISLGYFLHQQGIVSIFFLGAGRQPYAGLNEGSGKRWAIRPPSNVRWGGGLGFGRPAGKRPHSPATAEEGSVVPVYRAPNGRLQGGISVFLSSPGRGAQCGKGGYPPPDRWEGQESKDHPWKNDPLIGQMVFCSPLGFRWLNCSPD